MWMKSGTVSVTGLLNFTGYDAKLKINDIFAPSFETGTERQVKTEDYLSQSEYLK
jgi:hypothetical protein